MKFSVFKICLSCLLAMWLFVSCSDNKVTQNLQELFWREVILPENLAWSIYNRDTTVMIDTVPRILVYYNAAGCSSCKIKEILKWQELVAEIDSSADSLKTQFLFVFNTSRGRGDLNSALFTYDFNYPVMCDDKESFEKVNMLPEESIFHVFLLDKENKIRLVGSPIDNDRMWRLYRQTIVDINNNVVTD